MISLKPNNFFVIAGGALLALLPLGLAAGQAAAPTSVPSGLASEAKPGAPTLSSQAQPPTPVTTQPAPASLAPEPITAKAPATDPSPGMSQNEGMLTAKPATKPEGDHSGNAAEPSPNAMINLVRMLTARKLLSEDEASALTTQATQEAEQAKTAAKTASETPPEDPNEETVRVAYVPDVLRQQMTEQIRNEVIAQAKEEKWAAPNSIPSWLSRVRFFGDVRLRAESLLFPESNAADVGFNNYNAINTGAAIIPIGHLNFVNNTIPSFNVDQNRQRLRLRTRFGLEANLDAGFTTGLRIATGSDDSPVTTNQTLGGSTGGLGSNGQYSSFGKYSIWLDRGFIGYDYGPDANHKLHAAVGRFENPFLSTTMVFDDDLGFDGAAFNGRYQIPESSVTPFGTLGAFPVQNTDLNFATTNRVKFNSTDKWLFGGQAGLDWNADKNWQLKVAVAYYDYEQMAGQLSSPFAPTNGAESSDTDNQRPAFAQNGNTYRELRNYTDAALLAPPSGTGGQYYGLASQFRDIDLVAQIDFDQFAPFHLQLSGEYIRNLAFSRALISSVAVNNLGSTDDQGRGTFDGSSDAYIVRFLLGAARFQKQWDWNFELTYRNVGSDSTPDSLADSDFGGTLAGTNLRGYTIGGGVALSKAISTNVRFMSSTTITGPAYRNDLVQFDINAKF